MIDKKENEYKGETPLKDWAEKSWASSDDRKKFFEAHLVPDVDLALENTDEFIQKRESLLKSKQQGIVEETIKKE